MASVVEPVEVDAALSRKRKIDRVLGVLDAAASPAPSPARKTSTFAPWDRSLLRDRLSTFRAYAVHALDSPVGALALARGGWCYAAPRVVQCTHCRARVALAMHDDTATGDEDVHAALERRFGEVLAGEGHRETCPWRGRSCPLDALRLPLADRKAALQAWQERTATFDQAGGATSLRLVHVDELPGTMGVAEQCSLLGWRSIREADLTLITCNSCFRRVMPAQGDESFDVLGEHHEYCPWICAATQGGSIPGWQLLRKHIDTDSRRIADESTEVQERSLASTAAAHDVPDENPRERVKEVKRKLGFL